MGEAGRPVEISYWSSSWQARVDGRPDEITAIYPQAPIPHYPFEAPSLRLGSPEQEEMANRYAPARAANNWMAGDGQHATQDLRAEGPGTLSRIPDGTSDGRGVRVASGWQVLISRSIPAALRPPAHAQVAFAVWDGGRQEVGARKMRSVWVPLSIGGAP
jgi:hypothetical protein